MEARIAKLEEFAADAKQRLVLIETRLDQTATKADVHEMTTAMIKWTVGTAVAIVLAAISVITVLVNTAALRSSAGIAPAAISAAAPAAASAAMAPLAAPVIIYLPVPVPSVPASTTQPSR